MENLCEQFLHHSAVWHPPLAYVHTEMNIEEYVFTNVRREFITHLEDFLMEASFKLDQVHESTILYDKLVAAKRCLTP